jgi:hypothetical protein
MRLSITFFDRLNQPENVTKERLSLCLVTCAAVQQYICYCSQPQQQTPWLLSLSQCRHHKGPPTSIPPILPSCVSVIRPSGEYEGRSSAVDVHVAEMNAIKGNKGEWGGMGSRSLPGAHRHRRRLVQKNITARVLLPNCSKSKKNTKKKLHSLPQQNAF